MKKLITELVIAAFSVLAFCGISVNDATKTPTSNDIDKISQKSPLYLKHASDILSKHSITLAGYDHYSHSSHESHRSHYSHYSSRD